MITNRNKITIKARFKTKKKRFRTVKIKQCDALFKMITGFIIENVALLTNNGKKAIYTADPTTPQMPIR